MAQMVLIDAFVSIGGVDYSDQLLSGTITYDVEEQDDTAMGMTSRSVVGGLKNWSAQFTFKQDEASGQTGANLFALVGTAVALLFRPDKSDGVGAANPNYSGTGLVQTYTPLGGTVGELSKCTVTMKASGGTALTRAES